MTDQEAVSAKLDRLQAEINELADRAAALVAERDAAGDDLKRLRDKFARRHKEALQAEARADAAEKKRDEQVKLGDALRLANANLRDENAALAARADALREAALAVVQGTAGDGTIEKLSALLSDRGQG